MQSNGLASGDRGTGAALRRRRALTLAIVAVSSFVAAAALAQLPAWHLVDLRIYDYLATQQPGRLDQKGPIIVAIDEPSLSDINMQWPWPRTLHAKLVRALRSAGAKAVALDVIFAEPSSPQNDAALAAALGPDVMLAADETLIQSPQADQLVRTEPLPAFTQAGARSGVASVTLDPDGVFRALPQYEDGFAAGLVAGQLAGDLFAERRLLTWFGPARSFPTVSYYQALDPATMLPPGFFKDRVVFVGLSLQNAPTIKEKAADAFATPFTVRTGQLMSGVEIQATIFDNLRRGLTVGVPGTQIQLLLLAAVVAAAALVSWRPLGWQSGLAAVAAVAGLGAASFLSLRYGQVFLSPAAAVLGYLLTAGGQAAVDYVEERRNRMQIIRAFSQYLSPALVQRLAQDPAQLRLGGERRTLTILFCDVRGFTTISEELRDNPEELTSLINRLLTPLSDCVLAHNGTIDKYIGDCLMAFWNAPLDDPDHALHAVGAALDMLSATSRLNAELAEEARLSGRPPRVLKIGIGINTGDCVVGNMGSARRFDYSALGDSVNLASRLEGASKNYATPLLIGEQTARAAESRYPIVELDRIRVKGRSALSPVFTVVSAITPDQRERHLRFLAAHYAGTPLLDPEEPAIPELEAYYRLVSGRENPVSA
jgi:adenylate cyclase